MTECQFLSKCPFFNDRMSKMPRSTEIMRNMFCKGEYESCARYVVNKALGEKKVPIDLFPNETKRAKEIIAERE